MTRKLERPLFVFDVAGVPKAQGSVRVVTGHRIIHDSHDLSRWRDTIQMAAVDAARRADIDLPLDRPVHVKAVFWLPRPKTVRRLLPSTKPDLDKLIRAVGDALSPRVGARVIADDSRIVGWRAVKAYADGRRPGAHVEVFPVDDDTSWGW